MEEPQASPSHPDSEHYREMARKLRELARQFRFPGARQELLTLALRYERRADQLDVRSAPAVSVRRESGSARRTKCTGRLRAGARIAASPRRSRLNAAAP